MSPPSSRLTRLQTDVLGAFFSREQRFYMTGVLSEISIGENAALPGGVAPGELRDYLRGLIDRLIRLAQP
jgi:hypothetical protein